MSQLLQDLAKAALVIGAMLLILALLWALVRSGGSGDGGAAGAAKRTAAAVRGAAADVRKDPRGAARGALGAAGGLAGKAWDGARDAWRDGSERRNRRGDAGEPDKPSWRDMITGRCPECSHHPKATAAATDGCECANTAWGCPCALRNRTAARREPDGTDTTSSTDDRPPADRPPPDDPERDGEDPRPADLEPTELDNLGESAAGQDDTPGHRPAQPTGDAMPYPNGKVTPRTNGEIVNIEQTRAAIVSIWKRADTQAEQAGHAQRQAKDMATAAEQMTASLTTADLDAQTLADISALQEAAAEDHAAASRLLTAAEAVGAAAYRAVTGMDARHRVVEEAVNATPHAAETKWYQHS